jgi:hypothetical protein
LVADPGPDVEFEVAASSKDASPEDADDPFRTDHILPNQLKISSVSRITTVPPSPLVPLRRNRRGNARNSLVGLGDGSGRGHKVKRLEVVLHENLPFLRFLVRDPAPFTSRDG